MNSQAVIWPGVETEEVTPAQPLLLASSCDPGSKYGILHFDLKFPAIIKLFVGEWITVDGKKQVMTIKQDKDLRKKNVFRLANKCFKANIMCWLFVNTLLLISLLSSSA